MQALNSSCVMAVDWGSKRLGIAISDSTRKFARPLGVILHTSRADDAEKIIELSRKKVKGVRLTPDFKLTVFMPDLQAHEIKIHAKELLQKLSN